MRSTRCATADCDNERAPWGLFCEHCAGELETSEIAARVASDPPAAQGLVADLWAEERRFGLVLCAVAVVVAILASVGISGALRRMEARVTALEGKPAVVREVPVVVRGLPALDGMGVTR